MGEVRDMTAEELKKAIININANPDNIVCGYMLGNTKILINDRVSAKTAEDEKRILGGVAAVLGQIDRNHEYTLSLNEWD